MKFSDSSPDKHRAAALWHLNTAVKFVRALEVGLEDDFLSPNDPEHQSRRERIAWALQAAQVHATLATASPASSQSRDPNAKRTRD